jgi:NAD(P)H-hydrate epimerase
VGPGIGVGDEATEQLLSILQLNDMPLVLDADALNILAANPTWIQQLPAGTIITPHRREMERLLGGSYASHELMEKAHDLAMNHQLNIVLKGAFTQVFTSDGQIYINTTGNAGMATAGSGDVLTGIILGLLARQYTPDVAVRLGVYLHGLAGDLASAELGEESLIASDIINYLPQAFLKIQKL